MSQPDRVDPVSSDTGSTAFGSGPGESAAARSKRKKRWGLRTLGCLAVVITALAVAGAQEHHTLGTFGCVVIFTGAAIYCSYRGIQDLLGLEWYRRRLDARRDDEL